MTEQYYRLHREDAPEFSAENAWSGVWGMAFSADGARYECPVCDGLVEDEFGECDNCAGEGWFDCDAGYSCCYSAADLLDYFSKHNAAADTDPVVIFEGNRVGNGCDGEPLVIPTAIVRWTTIGELRQELEEAK